MQPDDVDEIEAKKQRKAAKRAAKEAAAAAEAAAEVEEAQVTEKKAKKAKIVEAEDVAAEVDEAEAKRQRKAARQAAREAVASEEVIAETLEKPQKANKEKREAEEVAVAAEAPKAKKSKTIEAAVNEVKDGDIDNSFKVFIKGLPYTVDEAKLRKDFSECGDISEFKMPVDQEGWSKGFAFIQFASETGFVAALKYDKMDYGGRYLNVSKVIDKNTKGNGETREGDWQCPSCSERVFASKSNCRKCGTAKPGGEADNENTVFIRGLPWSVTEDVLRKDFSDCGEIVKLSLPKNEQGQPKGISFIKYKSQAGIDAALKYDNTEYSGRTIFVSIAGKVPVPQGNDGKGKGKGKGKDGKGKGKDNGKSKAPSASRENAYRNGSIVEGAGEKKTFVDSDDE